MPVRRIIIALLVGFVLTVGISWLAMFLPPGNAWYGPPATDDLGVWREESSPKIPIWPGFIANMLIFACIWLAVMSRVRAVRACFRKQRNRCAMCGYLLTGLPAGATCPECGKDSVA